MPDITKNVKVIVSAVDKTESVLNKISRNLDTIGKKMSDFGKKLTKRVSVPLTALGVASFKMAGDFDQAMRQVNVMLRASEDEMNNYKKQVLEVAKTTGKAPEEVAQAWYQIVSAGYRGADSIKILETAMKGAVGGAADVVQTTAALTKAMNIFQFEGVEGANRAMDTFFGIVDSGLLTFEQMAAAFPRAAQGAAGLGVSIEETGAALAVLTKVSGSTDEAATSLNAAMVQLIKPSKALNELYEKWNVKNGPEAIKKFGGLAGVLKKVQEETGGSIDKLAELFPNVQAIRAVLPLITTNAEDYAKAIEAVGKSTGRTSKAFEEMAQGPGFQWQQMMNELKISSIKLGDAIAKTLGPTLDKLLKSLEGIVNVFSKLPPQLQQVIVMFGVFLALLGPFLFIFGKVVSVIGSLVFLANPVTIAVLAIIAVIGELIAIGWTLYKDWDLITEGFKIMFKELKDEIMRAWNSIKEAFPKWWKGFKENINSAIEWITGKLNGLLSLIERVKSSLSTLKEKAGGAVRSASERMRGFFGRIVGSRQFGGYIPETGPYLLHRGEYVLPAKRAGGGIVVNILGGYYFSEEAAEELGNKIIEKLKHQLRF